MAATKGEYYLVKRSVIGAAFNCLIIRHDDVMKELYSVDKDAYKSSVAIRVKLKFD